jgi:hypothetical protein
MSQSTPGSDLKAETERVLAVKNIHEGELLEKPNVVGVGVGFRQKDGTPTETVALIVMVSRKLPASLLDPADQIPPVIDGVPVDVQEVGEITAL